CNNKFEIKQLPVEAQFSPMFGITVTDVNEDGNLDLLTIGNSYSAETLNGFYDAGVGTYLQGDGKGGFAAVSVLESGFFVDGDAKALAEVTLGNGKRLFVATQNRDSLRIFTMNKEESKTTEVQKI